MTVLITLTTIGTDCSLFDIYSNVDGFISAFETDVPKASLSAGFSSANAPNGTTVIRVKAKGVCTNYKDIVLPAITTTTTSSTSTTTTTTTVACHSYSLYGINPGIAYWTNCDGSPGRQYINTSETYIVACAQAGSVTWSGGITQLSSCTA